MKLIKQLFLTTEMRYIIDCLDSISERCFTRPITYVKNGKLVITGNKSSIESIFVNDLKSRIHDKFKENSIHVDKEFTIEEPKLLIYSDTIRVNKYEHTFGAIFHTGKQVERAFDKIPDIIIHGGPDDFDHNNQIFLAEVKTTLKLTQNKFNVDLFKVNLYHEELFFKDSAFIIINTDITKVKDMFETYKQCGYYLTNRKGIYLIVKQSFHDKTQIFTQ